MTKEELYAHPGWADCTFEGARRQVLRLGLRTSFREKLEWLEEMDDLSDRFRTGKADRAKVENRNDVQIANAPAGHDPKPGI